MDLPTDSRGRTIENLLIEKRLVCLKNGSKIHYHIQSNLESAIDLSIATLEIRYWSLLFFTIVSFFGLTVALVADLPTNLFLNSELQFNSIADSKLLWMW